MLQKDSNAFKNAKKLTWAQIYNKVSNNRGFIHYKWFLFKPADTNS
jgi:hypothetical protein